LDAIKVIENNSGEVFAVVSFYKNRFDWEPKSVTTLTRN